MNLIVGYDPKTDTDEACMTVGAMVGVKMFIFNTIHGAEAEELYDKLVGTIKPLAAEPMYDKDGLRVKLSLVDEVSHWPSKGE